VSGASVIVAVSFDGRRSMAALVDGSFEVLDTVAAIDGASDLATHAGMVERKLRDARGRGLTVRGLAFALPEGRRWLDLRAAIAGRTNLPANNERVATAALRGERLRGAAENAGSAVLLDTDGLKLGLLLDRRPYVGVNGKAGDIAHLGIDRTGGVRCACGRTGCLTALLEAGAAAPPPPLPPQFPPAPSRALGWMTIAAISVVNTLNPAVLILQGSVIKEAAIFAWFAAAVRRGCLGPTRAGLVDISQARDDSALVGVAAGFAARRP